MVQQSQGETQENFEFLLIGGGRDGRGRRRRSGYSRLQSRSDGRRVGRIDSLCGRNRGDFFISSSRGRRSTSSRSVVVLLRRFVHLSDLVDLEPG